MRKKKLMSLVLAASMTLSALAVSGTPVMAEEEYADTMVIGLTQDPESFNPWLMAQSGREGTYYNNIFEPLARLNLEGEREYVLAKSCEPAGDACYQIELYDYIYDSAGNHITASDVIFSFDKCIEQGALSWALKYLDHFEEVDDYTLLMYVQDESAVAVDMLLKTCFIVSEDAFNASDDEFATDPVGTGPYLLESYVPGSEVVMTARDDYWQTDESLITTAAELGSVETIDVKIISDTSQLSLALEMGDIDTTSGSNGIVTADLDNFLNEDRTAKDGYNVVRVLDPLLYFTAFNCSENSVCQDEAVRQAISYAIDTDAIAENIYGSDGASATCNSSPYYADYDPSLDDETAYAYDPDKAMELLEEAGYSDGITITGMFSNEYTYAAQLASLMQAYLSAVGITMEIETYESALFQTTKNEEDSWDIYVDCTQGLNTPGRMGLMDMNGYTNGANGVFVTDDTLQEKFDAANNANTYSVDTVTELLEYVDEEDYVYPLFYCYKYVISRDNVTDIVLDRNYAIIPGASTIIAE